jgi:two-component system OmpR family sensor kinase
MKSMRQQLLLGLLIGIVVIASATGALVHRHVRNELDDLYNAHLQQMATVLARQLDRVEVAAQPPDSPSRAVASSWEEEHYLIQVWDRDGHLREQEIPAPLPIAMPLQSKPGFHRKRIGGESWRIYRADAEHIAVQIAQPEAARKSTIAETSLRLWLPLMLQIPLLTLLGWSSVRRGLRPLDKLSMAIARRQPDALQPLDVSAQPAELRPLVNTLNDLLSRLGLALQQQRNFVADAAHELRTPIAALQLQLDLLQRTQTPTDRELSMAELRAGLQRATHLIQQLLTIARAESVAAASAQLTVNLQLVGEQTVEHHLPLARARQIDLGVTRLEAVEIQCARVDIDAVVDNLLSNAIRYTPDGGKVDLALYRDGDAAMIEVTDTGPGIPATERSRIFDRFYRVLQTAADCRQPEGSGLGLAIVKAICDRYHATIVVDAGEHYVGTKFRVRWPLAEPVRQR